MFASLPPKLRAWIASLTSPSATHASGMLILLGILAALTEAQGHQEPIRVHSSKGSRSSSGSGYATTDYADDDTAADQDDSLLGAEAQAMTNQEMLYYVAMGMLVSQGLIRLLGFISNRRDAQAAAAAAAADMNNDVRRSKRGLTLNALEELDEEAKRRKADYLAALGDKAELIPSDSDDGDYEENETDESESEDEGDLLEESENEPEEEQPLMDTVESENEGRRRRVIYADD